MNIYPAIDLINNQCVRLHKGNFDEVTEYANDPLAVAQSFAKLGAQYLHVVDLDGAKKQAPAHYAVISTIVKNTSLRVQTGGGIRTEAQIKFLLDNGVQRVILGSIAIAQIAQVKKWFELFGANSLVLALDIRMNADKTPMLAAHGWQENTQVTLWELLDTYQPVGLQHVLCTDISRDGTLMGPNIDLYRECIQRYPQLQFQASGGVGDLEDIKLLAEVPMSATIIGKALYENKINLVDALKF